MQVEADYQHDAPALNPTVTPGPGPLFVSVLVILLVFAVATRSLVISAAALGSATLVVMRNLHILLAAPRRDKYLLVGTGGLLTLTLPFAVLRSETALAHYFVTVLSLLTAFLITRSPDTYFQASRAGLYASLGVVSAYLATSGLGSFPLERMIPDSSSNGITSYLVILQANYCVASYLVRRKLPFLSAVLTLGICIVGYGRGSILSTVGIIAVNFITFALRKSPRHFFAAVGVLALTGVWLAAVYGDEITYFVEANTKIGSGLYDQHRDSIIKDYSHLIDENSLLILTGADYKGTVIEADYNNNPHNSYIRAHHIFGLPYLMLMLSFPLLAFVRLPGKLRAYPLALITIMLFRAATEPILFPTMLDVFYFSVCFVTPQVARLRGGARG
jgi:hypothetical protein